jgi:preprotein translocase subunit SecA
MPDRRWGDGLPKQLKRKRNYRFVKKTETVAAITYQISSYPKLSGMTGTGKTAEVEFEKIYQLRRSQQLVQIKEKICQI